MMEYDDYPENAEECANRNLRLWLERERNELHYVLSQLNVRVHSHYDWNSDPDKMTLKVGDVLNPATLRKKVQSLNYENPSVAYPFKPLDNSGDEQKG